MSDVEIRRNEIIELLYTYKKYSIPKRLTLYRAIHSYTNARTGKSKTLADAGITFWESELLHDGYRITDQTGTRASRPYTTKIG